MLIIVCICEAEVPGVIILFAIPATEGNARVVCVRVRISDVAPLDIVTSISYIVPGVSPIIGHANASA